MAIRESTEIRFSHRVISRSVGYDVFLSYRQGDARQYAKALHDELERRGLLVFLDESDEGPGASVESFTRLACSARCLVVLVTDGVFDSPYVREEGSSREPALDDRDPRGYLTPACVQGRGRPQAGWNYAFDTAKYNSLVNLACPGDQWELLVFCRDSGGGYDCDVEFAPTDLSRLMLTFNDRLWSPSEPELEALIDQ